MYFKLLSLWLYLQPAPDDSPQQCLGIKLISLARRPSQALLITLEPGQQAFPL